MGERIGFDRIMEGENGGESFASNEWNSVDYNTIIGS